MWEIIKNKIRYLLSILAILLLLTSYLKANDMEYITGANEFLLSNEEISALKVQAVKNGDAKAAYRLYEYYQYSEFNEKESIKWIEMSADNGYPLAQYNLALRYLGDFNTPYVAVDIERAKKLLVGAKQGGIKEAKIRLEELESEKSR